ncbi:MAG: NnrU family protein [Hyphomicrobiales bacterium]
MAILAAGLLVFVGVHMLPTMPVTRARLVSRLGGNGYKLLFTAVSLAGFALMVFGYIRAPFVEVWSPPFWLRHLTIALMLPALVFLAAYQMGGRLAARLKHPFLAAVKTWATAHLLANGDLASILLFGALLAYTSYDRISVKRRGLPKAKQLPAWGWRDAAALGLGVAYFVAIVVFLHEWVIGVPVLL